MAKYCTNLFKTLIFKQIHMVMRKSEGCEWGINWISNQGERGKESTLFYSKMVEKSVNGFITFEIREKVTI